MPELSDKIEDFIHEAVCDLLRETGATADAGWSYEELYPQGESIREILRELVRKSLEEPEAQSDDKVITDIKLAVRQTLESMPEDWELEVHGGRYTVGGLRAHLDELEEGLLLEGVLDAALTLKAIKDKEAEAHEKS